MTGGNDKHGKPDMDALRARLAAEGGRSFWRGLEELEQTPRFKHFAQNEFPSGIGPSHTEVSRRDILKLMGASAALAGLTACTKLPDQKIVPYVNQPERIIPGKPLFYATSHTLGGVARGVVVESHMGRPTKVEGNPDHPGSLGRLDIFGQASVLDLYDPDRAQVVRHVGREGSWSTFLTVLNDLRTQYSAKKGEGLYLLTESITSPSLAAQIQELLKQFPSAQWHQYEPLARDNARQGAVMAFGEVVESVYQITKADVIVALDSDFLYTGPGSLRYVHDFAERRRIQGPESGMNRLYSIECTTTVTGAQADHRLRLRASEVEGFARALAAALGVKGVVPGQTPGASAAWLNALVADLQSHRGSSLVVAGDGQPAVVHALAHAINVTLENAGKTVLYTPPLEANPVDHFQSLSDLVAQMSSGKVETLIMLGGNPVYSAPVDLNFGQELLKAGLRIHLSLHDDETSELCHWHIPAAHYLEMWGDARAYDGTVSLIQPLIAPLYGGKAPQELLSTLLGNPLDTPHQVLREFWIAQMPGADFEVRWEDWLEKGLIPGTALPAKNVTLKPDFVTAAPGAALQGTELVFRPDPNVLDGQFSNNGWLMELARPFSKLTWDNVVMVSPATAQKLGVANEEVVEVRYQGRAVRGPLWVMPGHADDCVLVQLGFGRSRGGRIASGTGYNAYSLRTTGKPWFDYGAEVHSTGQRYRLANTQHHHIIETGPDKNQEEESIHAFNRDLVRVATLEEYKKDPNFAKDPAALTTKAPSLVPRYDYNSYAWGMAIDLNSCTGCNACVVACQSENNIAVVGKDQVMRGREMQWIRIDNYYRGSLDDPEIYSEAVPCQQCENAPCEVVCPVGATVHSPEGLNEMIYNRCVGTRYCSNNCPYKVRRFNFYLYSDWDTPSLYGQRNPDVTVRSRGVMEKCTYCIQRINEVRIKAEEQDRPIQDGEIVTACQQTCPTQAIVFGNINDPGSKVSKLKAQSRNYSLVADINTRPRTTYLAKVRNPNPEIKES